MPLKMEKLAPIQLFFRTTDPGTIKASKYNLRIFREGP